MTIKQHQAEHRRPARGRALGLFGRSVKLFMIAAMALCIGAAGRPAAAQMAYVMHGIGPDNLAMGGTGVALPGDIMSALMWNPALISEVERAQASIAIVVLRDRASLASTNASTSGKQDSDTEPVVLPNLAYVRPPKTGDVTFGFGLFAVAGVATNYASDGSQPITQPAPVGFGRVAAEYTVLQATPTVSFKLTSSTSIGFAPILSLASLKATPWTPGVPDADGNYPSGMRGDKSAGVGFQFGIHHKYGNWHFGASYKTEQWFQEFEIKERDALGDLLTGELEHPAIASVGIGHVGENGWDWAAELRYIDFNNAKIWGDAPLFDGSQRLSGFGLESIWYGGIGIRYRYSDRLVFRIGYAYAQSPIPSQNVTFSADAPAIILHNIGVGVSYSIFDKWAVSGSFHYGFDNEVTGPVRDANGVRANETATLGNGTASIGFAITRNF